MSANSSIKVWYMPRGLEEYTPGMDLGEPDEVLEPTFFIAPMTPILSSMSTQSERSQRGVENRKPRKSKSLTKEVFQQHLSDGMTRLEICEKYGIKQNTLKSYISSWGKADKS